MPDPAPTIQHTLVLRRTDPDQGMARFYALLIERDLFGTVRLVRNWGRIGSRGRELVEGFTREADAVKAQVKLYQNPRRACDRSPSRMTQQTRQHATGLP